MSEQENGKVHLSKRGKREVSAFVGHELLYDYLMGNLDEERRTAVADHVKFSRDAQLDLAKIEFGLKYAEKLGETVVAQPILNQINDSANYLKVLLQKSQFERWPQGLKWGLEALVVIAGIVVVLTLTPWQRVVEYTMSSGAKDIILAEVFKTESAPVVEEKPQFVDEDVVVDTKPEVDEGLDKPVAKVPTAATPSPSPAKTTTPVAAATPNAEGKNKAEVVSTGFLYRGQISVTNLAVIEPKITEKIEGMGGRKAGSVELGWKKTDDTAYYHFTIPEARYEDLQAFLSLYGSVQIIKEKHPRIMPDGIIRLIILVDEKK